MQRILIVVAHPDDEVLGMGGSIARFADEGKEIHLLIVTDGSTSQYKDDPKLKEIMERKRLETEKAAEILGIKSITYGNLPDMSLDITPHTDTNKVIESAIGRIQPDTVFTHFWADVNMDHQCVYESVMVAVRPVASQTIREVYCFNVPSSTEWGPSLPGTSFTPNVFVEIEKYKEKKYDAMRSYATELREYPHPRSIEYLRKNDEMTGLRIGIFAAEPFILLRKIQTKG